MSTLSLMPVSYNPPKMISLAKAALWIYGPAKRASSNMGQAQDPISQGYAGRVNLSLAEALHQG